MKTTFERFWPKVNKGPDCWLWAAAFFPNGYGAFRATAQTADRAHRVSYQMRWGPVPAGKPVLQTCGNRACVRPEHLYLGLAGVAGPSIEERFWARVRKLPGDGCWEWTGGKFEKGYGKLKVDGRNQYANRVCWEFTHGPIPEGLCVLHKCDNPSCCRPDHLFLGTQQDNMTDMFQKGRNSHGSGYTRTTEEDVRQIRGLHDNGLSNNQIAKKMKRHPGTISRIVRREVWRNIA